MDSSFNISNKINETSSLMPRNQQDPLLQAHNNHHFSIGQPSPAPIPPPPPPPPQQQQQQKQPQYQYQQQQQQQQQQQDQQQQPQHQHQQDQQQKPQQQQQQQRHNIPHKHRHTNKKQQSNPLLSHDIINPCGIYYDRKRKRDRNMGYDCNGLMVRGSKYNNDYDNDNDSNVYYNTKTVYRYNDTPRITGSIYDTYKDKVKKMYTKCYCKGQSCLALYCPCFATSMYCHEECQCCSNNNNKNNNNNNTTLDVCYNNSVHKKKRTIAIVYELTNHPNDAFRQIYEDRKQIMNNNNNTLLSTPTLLPPTYRTKPLQIPVDEIDNTITTSSFNSLSARRQNKIVQGVGITLTTPTTNLLSLSLPNQSTTTTTTVTTTPSPLQKLSSVDPRDNDTSKNILSVVDVNNNSNKDNIDKQNNNDNGDVVLVTNEMESEPQISTSKLLDQMTYLIMNQKQIQFKTNINGLNNNSENVSRDPVDIQSSSYNQLEKVDKLQQQQKQQQDDMNGATATTKMDCKTVDPVTVVTCATEILASVQNQMLNIYQKLHTVEVPVATLKQINSSHYNNSVVHNDDEKNDNDCVVVSSSMTTVNRTDDGTTATSFDNDTDKTTLVVRNIKDSNLDENNSENLSGINKSTDTMNVTIVLCNEKTNSINQTTCFPVHNASDTTSCNISKVDEKIHEKTNCNKNKNDNMTAAELLALKDTIIIQELSKLIRQKAEKLRFERLKEI